jgi:hypothetical protein
MNFITHACLPLVIVKIADTVQPNISERLNNKQLCFIGLAGILPDLLWPHFSLQQRMNSPTHTVWFLLFLIPVVYSLARWKAKENYLRFSIFFIFAFASHIALDSISGGVNLWYPIKSKIGTYFISYHKWLLCDLLLAVTTVIVLVFIKRKPIPAKSK